MKNEESNLNENPCLNKSHKKDVKKINDISNNAPEVDIDLSPRSLSPILNRKIKGIFNQKNRGKINIIRKCEKEDKLHSFSLFTNFDGTEQKSILGMKKSLTKNITVQQSSNLAKNYTSKESVKNIVEESERTECFNNEKKLNSSYITEKIKIPNNYNSDNVSYEPILDTNIGFKTATGKILNVNEKNLQAAKVLLEVDDCSELAFNKNMLFSIPKEISVKSQCEDSNTENNNLQEINKCTKNKTEQNLCSIRLQDNLKLDSENDFCSEITDSQFVQVVDTCDDFQKKYEQNINLNEITTLNDRISKKRKCISPISHSNSKLKYDVSFDSSEKNLKKTYTTNKLPTFNIKQNENTLEFQKLFEDKYNYDYHSDNSSPMSFESPIKFQKREITVTESNKCAFQTDIEKQNLVTNLNLSNNCNKISSENSELNFNLKMSESPENTLNCSVLNKLSSKKKLGFRTAIGSNIKINSHSLQKAKCLFFDIENSVDVESTNLNVSKINIKEKLSTKSESDYLKINELKIPQRKEHLINNISSTSFITSLSHCNSSINSNSLQTGNIGFSTASGTKIEINDKAMTKANSIFHDLLELSCNQKNAPNEKVMENETDPSKIGFKTASGSDIIISEEMLAKSRKILSDINKSLSENTLDFISTLGSENKVNKLLTKSDDTSDMNKSLHENTVAMNKSDNKLCSKYIQSKKTEFGTNVNSLNETINFNVDSFIINNNLRQSNKNIQNIDYEINDQNKNIFDSVKFPDISENKLNIYICSEEPKKREIKNLIIENKKEMDALKQLITVMEIRQTYLLRQEKIQQEATKEYISFRPGLLLKMKTAKNVPRMSLYEIKQSKENVILNLDKKNIEELKKVDSQNAKNINFNFLCPPNPPILILPEKVIIVPSISNNIGLREFEMSFITMPGINVSQLPSGWFQNHFRWIVWKLVSMDRQFSNYFCDQFLTPKNIMAQLKYRYDRDVHNNERTAIRKILEKDDCASRRMILCVAQIIALTGNNFEIEVTDGWYSVFASLDIPLQKMIERNKIVIGTKLITYGAKILNTENACHPLSAPSEIRLALNFNSTRRARWDCKLGFQRFQGPFSINLNSIDPSGGCIGKITVQILRVFPIKYLEKYQSDGKWVCRCEKSEQIRELEWQTEKYNYIEKVQATALKQLENEWKMQLKTNDSFINKPLSRNSELSNISCPEILSKLYVSDPDYFMNIMSKSQQNLIYEHQLKVQTDHATELAKRVTQLLENEKFTNRIVYPIICALVIDEKVSEDSNLVPFMLDYWNPDELVLEIFKEGCIISLNNIIPSEREPCTIQTSKQTKFKMIRKTMNSKFIRHYTSIEKVNSIDFSPAIPYFDTVGIIVRADCYENKRTVWIADTNKRILQIQQHINPLYCAALNNAKKGEIVCFYNLYIAENGQIQANWSTIITKYPTHAHLMDPLTELQNNLSLNLEKLIEDCNNEIK